MGNFLNAAGRKTVDVKEFLMEAAGNSTLKYKAEKGKKHYIYFPTTPKQVISPEGVQSVTNNLINMALSVHEWTGTDGKYHSTACAKGVTLFGEGGVAINDGSCPFCDRVSDAWEIYNYRYDLEKSNCMKNGEDLTKHMDAVKGDLSDERKAKDANEYMYVLITKFKADDNGNPVIGRNGLPEFELKIMRMSSSRLDKIRTTVENAGDTLENCEIVISYPDLADARLVTSKSTITLHSQMQDSLINILDLKKLSTLKLLNSYGMELKRFIQNAQV